MKDFFEEKKSDDDFATNTSPQGRYSPFTTRTVLSESKRMIVGKGFPLSRHNNKTTRKEKMEEEVMKELSIHLFTMTTCTSKESKRKVRPDGIFGIVSLCLCGNVYVCGHFKGKNKGLEMVKVLLTQITLLEMVPHLNEELMTKKYSLLSLQIDDAKLPRTRGRQEQYYRRRET